MARWGRAFPARPIYSHGPLVEAPSCTPQIRSLTIGTNTGSSPTVSATSPGDTQIGDFLLIIHGNDFYTLANMPTPSVTTGTPTVNAIADAVADGGTNLAHVKAYWAIANTAGANTVSVTETGTADEEKIMVLYVLTGVDTGNPIDDASNATAGAGGGVTVMPAATPATSDDLAVMHSNTGGGGAAGPPHTPPGDVTEQYDTTVGGLAYLGATKDLTAAGDTGTFTFTATTGPSPYGAVTITIRGECVEEAATPPPATVVEVPPRPRPTPVSIVSHGPIPEVVVEVVTPPPPVIVEIPPRPRQTPVAIVSHGGFVEGAVPQQAGTSFAGALAYGTAAKIASDSGRSVAGALARGVAIKVASPVGRCVGGALARGTAVKVGIPVGRSVAGALARGTATKIATTTAGRSVAGALARGISSKIASTSGFAYAGALTYGTTAEIPTPIGSSVAGASTQGTAAKTAIPSGTAVAGASTQGTATQPRQVSGVCAAGVSAYGVAVQGGDIVMDTQVLPLAQALRDCLCAWASVNPNPPQNCCFRVGTIAHDADLHTDLCCEGIAYVSIGDIWPSNVFPDEDSTQASKVCSPPSWGVELRAGIVRCAPTGTDTEMPSCDDWALAHIQTANDAQALRKTACCIRAWVQTNNPGMSVVIQRQVQTDPSGGCMERYFTVALQIPNCDC